MKSKKVIGIDPGNSGAFVLTDGEKLMTWAMPILKNGKETHINFDGVHELLWDLLEKHPGTPVYIERAIPMAMGAKSAFNYGRGFAALEIAIQLLKCSVTYIEPQKWAKEMHEGVSSDLKAKSKSLIAVKRLFPKLVKSLPVNTKGKLLDGPIDALLIAAYGLRRHVGQKPAPVDVGDFF